jgi:hypothetical protein
LNELRRNLIRRGLDDKQVGHRLDQMNEAFPDAQVTGYEALIAQMTNHPKDRHVLAAAVRGGAEVLVTENLRDFPDDSVSPFGVEVVSRDTFLLDQLDLAPADVLAALRHQVPAIIASHEPSTLCWPSLAPRLPAALALREFAGTFCPQERADGLCRPDRG